MLAVAVILPAHLSGSPLPMAAPSSGLINPRAIVYSPANGKVYAVDSSHGAVQIYTKAGDESRRVSVGAEPVSIAVNTLSGRTYVANAGDGTVSILDGGSDTVVATIPVGSHPYSIAADSVTGKVFVTHTFGNSVSVLDGATNAVTELKTGSVDLVAVNSRAGIVYLLGYGGAVIEVNEASGKFATREVGRHAWGLTLDDSSGTVYVTRIESSDLAALRPSASEAATLPAGAIPCAIAVDAAASTLYVANYGDNTVAVLDVETGRIAATVSVGEHPKAIALDSVRKLVYVANTDGNSVTVIDARSNSVVATLPAGKSPYALAVVPGSEKLYVANESDMEPSTVVDLRTIGLPKL